ncbi:beta-lactamase/transpeptidase-like protein [Coniochaeta sp. PMI_546]|nr:beta-lactamase/transpeptidase-like protein [Coniochaeta sp. PMI_546]
MKRLLLYIAALLLPLSLGAPNCPPLGPVFPKPSSQALLSSPSIKAAIANLTATFTARDADNSTGSYSTSYSIEVWSASDAAGEPIFSWYHTAPNLTNTWNTTGVRKVDKNTVYRLGSLTKIFTIYTWLVQDGDTRWNEPITKYIPELAAVADKAKNDPVGNVDWGEVTIGALASQMAGVVRDYGLLGEITQEMNQTQVVSYGFPPLNDSDPTLPQCGEWPQCNRTEFFNGLLQVVPSYAPFTTPAYANTAFQILGYALETIKGKSFQSMMEDSILKPLGLNHTYYASPPNSVGLIPGTPKESGWSYQLGDESPAGNMYSSVADISALGRSILKSALLRPAQTRRWLKPASLTSEPVAGVGYPWGVRRIILPETNGKRTVDAYNKAGRVGYYGSLLNLLPDYDVGFSILIGGPSIPGNMNFNLADIIGEQLLPALEAAAREQADATYAGFYYDKAANSTMRITTQSDRPGLGIDQWMSNGTDMAYVAVALQGQYTPVQPTIRLYPTGLETTRADGSKRVAFKATFEDLQALSRPNSMFSTDCGSWVSLTAVTYGSMPLDQFAFEIDAKGKVVSVEPIALRVKLQKA